MTLSNSRYESHIHSRITQTIMAQLRDGIRPWMRPWESGVEGAFEGAGLPLRDTGQPSSRERHFLSAIPIRGCRYPGGLRFGGPTPA